MGATGPIGLPGATDPTGFSGASILPTTNVWTGSNSFNNGITTGDINCSGNIDMTSSNENLKFGYQAFNSNTTGTQFTVYGSHASQYKNAGSLNTTIG